MSKNPLSASFVIPTMPRWGIVRAAMAARTVNHSDELFVQFDFESGTSEVVFNPKCKRDNASCFYMDSADSRIELKQNRKGRLLFTVKQSTPGSIAGEFILSRNGQRTLIVDGPLNEIPFVHVLHVQGVDTRLIYSSHRNVATF